MARRDEIVAFLDDLLEIGSYGDYGPNGLQVPGAEEVSVVASGVSAHRQLFEHATDVGAQLLLCHHGLFWDFHPSTISPAMKERLRVLFDTDMSLAAYHLPLDAHPDVGNNALICEALGLASAERFAEHRGRAIGLVGRSAEGIPFERLRAECTSVFGQEPFVWDCGPDTVHSVGVVSGGAAGDLAGAIALGLDAFITGEPAEHLVSESFGVEHRFVAVPNPI
jgi:dinuclear metal center YbgI/SA1388 family protein